MKASSIVLAVSLGVVSLAWADHTEDHEKSNTNKQQLSRSPYSAPAEKDTTYEDDKINQETNARAEKNYKTLQLHMLGRRPYAAKGTN